MLNKSMGLELFMPTHEDKNCTTKDYAVTSLIEKGRMTVRELQRKIRKDYGHAVSYQAVRKAVFQLMDMEVIREKNKKYELNEAWIDRIMRFCNSYKRNPMKPQAAQVLAKIRNGDGPQMLEFRSLYDRRNFIEELESEILPTLNSPNVVILVSQTQRGFNYEKVKERMDLYKKNKIKFYLIYKYKNRLNDLARQNYSMCGGNVLVGCDYPEDNWIEVYGDLVLQTFPPNDLKLAEKSLSRRKNMSEEVMEFIEKTYRKNYKIKAIFQSNRNFAESLRKSLLSYFKK